MQVRVFYVEMTAPPTGEPIPAPRDGLVVLHARRPSVAYYRFLYNEVGRAYHWLSRGKLSDAELDRILANPANEVHVLHVDGAPAGFVEFDRRDPNAIEIVQFGLMGKHIGRGLGRWFLRWAVDLAWSYAPRRLWLHTCTLDHPAALPNYQKAGFQIFREETIERDV